MTKTPDNGREPAFKLKSYEKQDRMMALYADVAVRASAAMPAALATEIGTLSIAPRLHDDEEVTSPQFRSGLLPAFADGEVRFHHIHGGPAKGYGELLVDMLVTGSQAFVDAGGVARQSIDLARKATIAEIDRDGNVHPSATLSAVGFLIGRFERPAFDVVIELEMLGPGLFPVIERIHARSIPRLQEDLRKLLSLHRKRVLLAAQFRADHQRGWIEQTTSRILEAVGMDIEFALEHLTHRSSLVFDFDDDVHRAMIEWKDGVLRSSFWTNEAGLSLMHGHVLRPETVVVGEESIGQRLGQVFEHPYLPPDAVITHVGDSHEYSSATVELAIPRSPIPDAP